MKLHQFFVEGAMKRSDPYISGELEGTPLKKEEPKKTTKNNSVLTRAEKLASRAGVSVDSVMNLYKHERSRNTSFAAVWSNVKRKLQIHEAVDIEDEEDDFDTSMYEREKKVSLLILRAFRKCGLEVAEHEDRHSGVREKGEYASFDVLYSDDDHEAMVQLEEATLEGFVKLQNSGLIDGKCEIVATRRGTLQVSFNVHPSLHSGEAEITD